MKILVLGAGAIGGYFGARLVQAGADVQFLVRERRAAQLAERGLVVRSPHGDFTVSAATVLQAQIDGPADLVLLTCKAWDLDAAIASITPAMGPHSHVLPLLNGLAHIDALIAAFGAERVAGGSCGIPATLTPAGEVVQLGAFHRITVGALPGTSADARPKLQALHERFSATPVTSELAADMMLALWEKFVGLTTLAAMTCLMRASAGDIVGTDEGAALMAETLAACEATARAAGHVPREAALAPFKAMLSDPASPMTASMLRDLEAGGRTEGAHIVGDMLARARAAGIEPGPLRAAWCHLQAAERRRARGWLISSKPMDDEATLQALLTAARAARAHGYAPYSHFLVGAAVLDEQGRIHAGCNVENAAYPQGWCAETSALAHLVTAGGRRVLGVAVAGVADAPVTPCGGCRQKLREFAADDCPVWVADMGTTRARFTLGELLPASFGPEHLQR